LSQFWNASTTSYCWDRIALYPGAERHTTLEENALILAAVNVTMADANIAAFDAKYHYVAWRPVTAIPAVAGVADRFTQGAPQQGDMTCWH
jgi:hypothetical protein